MKRITKQDNSEDFDCYDCQYTKHKTQKSKTWQDGILIHNKTENKLAIYDSADQDCRIDQMFKANWKLYDISETIHFPRHLCQIENKINTPQKFIKQKYDSNTIAITKKIEKAEEDKVESSPFKPNLDSKMPSKIKTPIKSFQRKKFQPPVAKPAESIIDHFDSDPSFSNMDKGYYSFGSGGFVNSRKDNSVNTYSNRPQYENNETPYMPNSRNKFDQKPDLKPLQSRQQPNIEQNKKSKNSKENEQDVYEYFKKFKPIQNNTNLRKEEYKVKSTSYHEDGVPSDDEDLLLDKQINDLTKAAPIKEVVNEFSPDYNC